MYQQRKTLLRPLLAAALAMSAGSLPAFDSGSTGADGAFSPATSQTVDLPGDGVFNYTTVNIPPGITITYNRNDANTPVIILAQGDVVIDGTIDVSGTDGTSIHDGGNPSYYLGPVPGGPGGYDGGRGGIGQIGTNPHTSGGNGRGPGGGLGGEANLGDECGGGGGGFGGNGESGIGDCSGSMGGTAYGGSKLVPLIGGSGAGGGAGAPTRDTPGAGGGGGGGAILIASSTEITINGAVLANGGDGGRLTSFTQAGDGGGGSGGAIRLVAGTIDGTGTLEASGGDGKSHNPIENRGYDGSVGRIRVEAEANNYLFSGTSMPTPSLDVPGQVFVADIPAIQITFVDGMAVPAIPNGRDDVVLPEDISNPVSVELAGTHVPLGTIVDVTVTPTFGPPVTVQSSGLAGTDESATTASASVALPQGASVLTAKADFTIVAALGDFYSQYAMGERVERVEVAFVPGQGSRTRFVTTSGSAYTWPSHAIAGMN